MNAPAARKEWNVRAVDLGRHESDRACTCCGRILGGAARMLELDQRTRTYHDFGGIPAESSQGWFPFGLKCSQRERAKARAAIAKTEKRA